MRARTRRAPCIMFGNRQPFDVLVDSGLLGWAAVLVAGIVFFVGIVLFASPKRSRALFLALTLAGLLPLAIGTAGTMLGHRIVETVAAEDSLSEDEAAAGHEQANLAMLVGGVASTPVVLLGLLGILMAHRRDQRSAPSLPDESRR